MLKDLVMKNRSYRGYKADRRITREELTELVDYTRYCASSINAQPLVYYLAYEADEVAEIQKNTIWARALPDITLPHEGKCPTAFIIIMLDKNIDDSPAKYQKDVGIVAQTILLAAVEKGLGGCMIGSFSLDSIKKVLNLDEHLQPMLVVAIGEPDEEIVLEEIEKGGSIKYYRDEKDVHHVPKRKLEDIVMVREK